MEKSGHLYLGGALGTILILLTHYFYGWFPFTINNVAVMVAVIYIYSLIADGDLKNSTITWTFIPIGIVSIAAAYFLHNNLMMIGGISLLAVTFIAAQFFPHRGFTHSILFGIVVSLPWIYFSWNYSVLAFLCYYSHLAGDELFFKLI